MVSTQTGSGHIPIQTIELGLSGSVMLGLTTLFLVSVEHKEAIVCLSAGDLIMWKSQLRGWHLSFGPFTMNQALWGALETHK